MDRRSRKFREQVASAKKEALGPVDEVLGHLYRGILAVSEFTLKDGTKARLDPYIEPTRGEDGHATCGFDVLLDNGSHLEFTVSNTGWGKAIAPKHGPSRKPRGRGR